MRNWCPSRCFKFGGATLRQAIGTRGLKRIGNPTHLFFSSCYAGRPGGSWLNWYYSRCTTRRTSLAALLPCVGIYLAWGKWASSATLVSHLSAVLQYCTFLQCESSTVQLGPAWPHLISPSTYASYHSALISTDCAILDINAVHFRHGALVFDKRIQIRQYSLNFGTQRRFRHGRDLLFQYRLHLEMLLSERSERHVHSSQDTQTVEIPSALASSRERWQHSLSCVVGLRPSSGRQINRSGWPSWLGTRSPRRVQFKVSLDVCSPRMGRRVSVPYYQISAHGFRFQSLFLFSWSFPESFCIPYPGYFRSSKKLYTISASVPVLHREWPNYAYLRKKNEIAAKPLHWIQESRC